MNPTIRGFEIVSAENQKMETDKVINQWFGDSDKLMLEKISTFSLGFVFELPVYLDYYIFKIK